MIQLSLTDSIPRTSQKLINRDANRLLDKPRTAGAVMENYAYDDDYLKTFAEAMYTLGQRCGVEAQRRV